MGDFDVNLISSQYYYDYSHFDTNMILDDYAAIDFSSLTDESIQLNDKFDMFLLKIRNIANKHYPQKGSIRRN